MKTKIKINLWIFTLFIISILCFYISFEAENEMVKSFSSNICTGMITGLIVLIFTNWKSREERMLKSKIALIEDLNDEIKQAKDLYSKFVSVTDSNNLEIIQDKALDYYSCCQNILQFIHRDKKLCSLIINEEEYIKTIKKISCLIVHVVLKYDDLELLKKDCAIMYRTLLDYGMKVYEVKTQNMNDINDLNKSMF